MPGTWDRQNQISIETFLDRTHKPLRPETVAETRGVSAGTEDHPVAEHLLS